MQLVRPFAEPLALGAKIASAYRRSVPGSSAPSRRSSSGCATHSTPRGIFYLVQISHAVRICVKLFGKPYASTIVAATEAAITDEHRAA